MATYYISPSGNDSSGDGTTGNPWKTLEKGITAASSGDTIICKDGTYYGKGNCYWKLGSGYTKQIFTKSGITIQAQNKHAAIFDGGLNDAGERIWGPTLWGSATAMYNAYYAVRQTIKGSAPTTSELVESVYQGLMIFQNVDNVTIDGLKIINVYGRGILFSTTTGQSTGITIKNCRIDGTLTQPFYVDAGKLSTTSNPSVRFDDMTIQDCTFSRCGFQKYILGDATGWVAMHTPGTNFVVERCTFFYVNPEIGPKQGSSHDASGPQIYRDNWVIMSRYAYYNNRGRNAEIYRNRFIGFSAGRNKVAGMHTGQYGMFFKDEDLASASCDDYLPATNVKVYNNIFWKQGLVIQDYGTKQDKSPCFGKPFSDKANIYFGGNTIIAGEVSVQLSLANTKANTMLFENNIVYAPNAKPSYNGTQAGVVFRNNVMPASTPSNMRGSDSIITDTPQMVNPMFDLGTVAPSLTATVDEIDTLIQNVKNRFQSGNFMLKSTSAARNAGTATKTSPNGMTPVAAARSLDFLSASRGQFIDIGALEYDGTVVPPSDITASFLISKTGTILTNENVTFTDTSTGDTIVEWNWTMGDGTFYSGAGEITHSWDRAGTYTVKLVVTGLTGSVAEVTRTITITSPDSGDPDSPIDTRYNMIFDVTTFAAPTNTNEFDVTLNLGGYEPKWAIFVVTAGITEGTAADGAFGGIGLWSPGDYGAAVAMRVNDDSADNIADRERLENCVATYLNPKGQAESILTVRRFGPNKFTLKSSEAFAAGYRIMVIAGGGDLIKARRLKVMPREDVGGLTEPVELGIRPDLLFAIGCNTSDISPSNRHLDLSFGMGVLNANSTAFDSVATGWYQLEADVSAPKLRLVTNKILLPSVVQEPKVWDEETEEYVTPDPVVNLSAIEAVPYAEVGDLEPTKIQFYTRDASPFGPFDILAIELPKDAIKSLIMTRWPTEAGTLGISTEALNLVMALPTQLSSESNNIGRGVAGMLGLYAATGGGEYQSTWTVQNGVTTSVTGSHYDDALEVFDHTLATTYATGTMDLSEPATLTVSTAPTTAYLLPFLVIGGAAEYEQPVADFVFAPGTADNPAQVNEYIQFTDKSVGNITSWLWRFGDTTTSTDKSPQHRYYNAGYYSVILEATNASGTATKMQIVHVGSSAPPPPEGGLVIAGKWYSDAINTTTDNYFIQDPAHPSLGHHSHKLDLGALPLQAGGYAGQRLPGYHLLWIDASGETPRLMLMMPDGTTGYIDFTMGATPDPDAPAPDPTEQTFVLKTVPTACGDQTGTGQAADIGVIDLSSSSDYGLIQFDGVEVPQGAAITSATLTVYVKDNLTPGTPDGIDIYGDDVDNSAELAESSNNISGRVTTTATTAWTGAAYSSGGLKSVDVTDIVTEIVARAGWVNGNAMSFILVAGANTSLRITDGATNAARIPVLTVIYEA